MQCAGCSFPFHRAAIFLIYNFPTMKKVSLDVLETIFAPTAVARQLALVIALETGVVRKRLVIIDWQELCFQSFWMLTFGSFDL